MSLRRFEIALITTAVFGAAALSAPAYARQAVAQVKVARVVAVATVAPAPSVLRTRIAYRHDRCAVSPHLGCRGYILFGINY
jgi:hypothetical protein